MNLHLYRYGESCRLPGLSIGIARQAPRGVRREEYARRGYFDAWLPLLAPSRELVAAYRGKGLSFAGFARRYRAEMRRPEARQAIRLVAALALRQRINLGCFCADESRCHRSVLHDLVVQAADELPCRPDARAGFASPACAMPEIED